MSSSYPGTIQSVTDYAGTVTLANADHANWHATTSDTVEAIETVLGTTAGTSVLKNFAAGDFPARINSSNVLQQALQGTINTSTLGTPTVILGSDATGDLHYRSAGGTMTRLGVGSNGQYLTTNGTTPSWGSVSTDYQSGTQIYATDGGANDTYAITLSPVPGSLTTGMVVHFKANTVNTGSASLNVNSLGEKPIYKSQNKLLDTGDIKANQLTSVIYDGTNFQLLGMSGKRIEAGRGTSDGSGDVSVTFTQAFSAAPNLVVMAAPAGGTPCYANISAAITTSGVSIRTYGSVGALLGTVPVEWMAFGY